MAERMSGTDALLWHMERPETLMHTLKTVVVDPSERGEPVTLAGLVTGIEALIGRVPHLSQRVRTAPWFPGRPFWVTDPGFAVADHVEEVTAAPPGDRAALDEVHSRLASTPLDLERPFWTITLVHGLEGGRQAIVVRIHHAVVDGGAALNGLLMLTDDEPGEELPPTDPPEPEQVTDRELQREVLQEAPALRARPPAAPARHGRQLAAGPGVPAGAPRPAVLRRRAEELLQQGGRRLTRVRVDGTAARAAEADREEGGRDRQRRVPRADRGGPARRAHGQGRGPRAGDGLLRHRRRRR